MPFKNETEIWEEKSPAFLWYARDWLTDMRLRQCSRAARSVWADALSAMHLAPIKGRLDAESRAELCSMLFDSVENISHLIDELIAKKVADSDGPGSLISRRMFGQGKLKKVRAEAGKLGAEKRWSQNGKTIANAWQGLSTPLGKNDSKNGGGPPLINRGVKSESDPESDSKTDGKTITKMAPSSSSSSSIGKDPPTKIGSSKGTGTPAEPAPFWPDCKYFRTRESEIEEVKSRYRKDGIPEDLIPFAVFEIEDWLSNDESPKARAARKLPTHYRRCWATWVIKKATERKQSIGSALPALAGPSSRKSFAVEQREREVAAVEGVKNVMADFESRNPPLIAIEGVTKK